VRDSKRLSQQAMHNSRHPRLGTSRRSLDSRLDENSSYNANRAVSALPKRKSLSSVDIFSPVPLRALPNKRNAQPEMRCLDNDVKDAEESEPEMSLREKYADVRQK